LPGKCKVYEGLILCLHYKWQDKNTATCQEHYQSGRRDLELLTEKLDFVFGLLTCSCRENSRNNPAAATRRAEHRDSVLSNGHAPATPYVSRESVPWLLLPPVNGDSKLASKQRSKDGNVSLFRVVNRISPSFVARSRALFGVDGAEDRTSAVPLPCCHNAGIKPCLPRSRRGPRSRRTVSCNCGRRTRSEAWAASRFRLETDTVLVPGSRRVQAKLLLTAADGWCPSFGVQDAGVLVKGLLRYAVERERGDGALQVRSHHTPRAVGAAPAREVVVLCPDHMSCHRYT
jgi:hypothetical protein